MKESDVQKSILQWLKLQRGCFAVRTNNVGVPIVSKSGQQRFRPSPVQGLSDILVCWHGRFVAIEVKSPQRKNNLSEAQKEFLRSVEQSGGVALCVSSLEELQEALSLCCLNDSQ